MHKLVNGVRVELTQEEIDARVAEEAAFQAERDYYNTYEKYKEDRAKAYPPIGDQLDALLKQFNYMRLQAQLDPTTATMKDVVDQLNSYNNLVQDLDDIIALWLAVKAQYPKPVV